MAKYRKFVVALITLILITLNQFFGVEVFGGGENAEQIANIADIIIVALGAFGVFQVANETDTPTTPPSA